MICHFARCDDVDQLCGILLRVGYDTKAVKRVKLEAAHVDIFHLLVISIF